MSSDRLARMRSERQRAAQQQHQQPDHGESQYHGNGNSGPYSSGSNSNDYAHASTPSLHGAAPPPSYSNSNSSNARRIRSRSQSPRPGGPEMRQDSYPPVPGPHSNAYGGREDEAAGPQYAQHANPSSLALNSGGGNRPRDRRQDSYGVAEKGSNNTSQNYPQSPPYSAHVPPGSASLGGTAARQSHVLSDAPQVDMAAFFDELDSVRNGIRELEQAVTYLDQLHSRGMQGTGGEEITHELEQASGETRRLTNTIRKRIKAMQETTRIRTHGQAEQDRQVRKTQVEGIKNRFLEQVQNYQNMEMKYRDKAKARIERQYQVVRPDATPEEIKQVVQGGQEVQIFAQALRQSNRVGNAQNVLNEVQNRHEDIKKIEKTLVELYQLFQDMAQLVEEQDEQIVEIERKAEEVVNDIEAGHQEIVQATGSAKKARKKRKCCAIVGLILFLVIAGVVAYLVVKVILPKINENKAKEESDKDKEDKPATRTVTQSAGTQTQRANVQPSTATAGGASATAARATTTSASGGGADRRRSRGEDPELAIRAYLLE